MDTLAPILHKISYMGLPLLFAMVLHEYAHGWAADKCGDPTAKLQGRLTLNPLAQIDPLGTIILPLLCLALPGSFLLGWAKPVPVDPRNMRQPRRDMALVAAAGPGMNLVLAVVGALIVAALFPFNPSLRPNRPPTPHGDPTTRATRSLSPITVMPPYPSPSSLPLSPATPP